MRCISIMKISRFDLAPKKQKALKENSGLRHKSLSRVDSFLYPENGVESHADKGPKVILQSVTESSFDLFSSLSIDT